jgi:perosamine synthetase
MNDKTPKQIPLSSPSLGKKELEYVVDCLESTWISSAGKYVDRFEHAFAQVAGTRHAITCSNGTVALHLALIALGLRPDDEVLVPTLTFVACANSVAYCGGKPVFVDVDRDIWSIDAAKLESQITAKTRGIIAVHLRGHPADMEAIVGIARRHGLFVVKTQRRRMVPRFRQAGWVVCGHCPSASTVTDDYDRRGRHDYDRRR